MIRFALKCDGDHDFDAWFASGEAFDDLCAAEKVNCPICGSASITKALMSPRVSGREIAMSKPLSDTPLAKLRSFVERKADYVGSNFAEKARAMHDGDEPHRPIYGEAALPEARKLVEDGVPIAPLPFVPKAKIN